MPHYLVAAAVTEGDVERSQSITRTHLRRVLADMEELATRFPDYFELHPREWVAS